MMTKIRSWFHERREHQRAKDELIARLKATNHDQIELLLRCCLVISNQNTFIEDLWQHMKSVEAPSSQSRIEFPAKTGVLH